MPDPAPPDECAHCGSAIPRGARACPACGADERTGWREVSIYDDLDLPDSAYDDDTSAVNEPSRRGVNGLKWYWYCVAALLLALVVAWALDWRA